MKYYGLYKITNLVNGKMYIGQHVTSNIDDGYMGSGHVLLKALKKYGIESFRKEWLGFYEDQDELDYMERVFVDETWISRSDTYNLVLGGRSRGGRQLTEEEKQKISQKLKGHKVSQLTRSRISKKTKGKKLSEVTRKKMSATRKKMPCPNKGQHWHWKTTKNHKSNNKGLHWYNDGKQNKMAVTCPKGFTKGMLQT